MDGMLPGPSSDDVRVAGRWRDDQEKSYIRQAVFLLRYRLKTQERLGGSDGPGEPRRVD